MSGEKTEKPTQKKLDDAREEGQLPQRKNVLEAALVSMGVLAISVVWPNMADKLGTVLDIALDGTKVGFDDVISQAGKAAISALLISLTITIAFGAGLLLFNLLLTKFNFAVKSLTPKFEKLNPVTGLKGIFSKNTLYNFGRLMILFPTISVIVYFSIRSNIPDVVNAAACGLQCLAMIFPPIILNMTIQILAVLIILAAVDFKLQTMLFINQNKMTKDDVKREHKGSEGDPQVKGKRKEIADEDRVLPSPKDVTHVVYSQSHLVAILYNDGETPFVIMKAKGGAVARLQQKFRGWGARCANIPSVAADFHRRYPVGDYVDVKAAEGMSKILQATEAK